MPASRATTSRLQPGQDSIDRAKPYPFRGGWGLTWRVRLHSDELIERRTQAPTKGEVRARARRTAKELLNTPGSGSWTPRSMVLDYLEQVTLPLLESPQLSESTQLRYELSYRLLRGECSTEGCKHKRSLAGLSLYTAMQPRRLKECLEEIAQLHGARNVKHCKLVASKYLARPLKLDGIIEYNPLIDLDLDLSRAKKPKVTRGGHSLTMPEYRRVISYLLEADPTQVEQPKRGRWSIAERIVERETCIDIVLTQATTGLRISELCNRPAGDWEITADGTAIVHLPPHATKTGKSRPVPVLDPRVSERIRARLAGITDPQQPVFGAPADATQQWDASNRNMKLAKLYIELAEQCKILELHTERGHVWRTTLNSLLADYLPEDARIRLLGHTADVNRQHYTAVTDTSKVLRAASVLRADTDL